MNETPEHFSRRLDEALHQPNGPRHDPSLRPFMEISDALRREAARPSEALDPQAAKNQRIILMNMANSQKQSSVSPTQPASNGPKRGWLGGIIATTIVAVLALVILLPQGSRPPTTTIGNGRSDIVRIVIPEAHAGDAFALSAEIQDAAGAETGTAFALSSAVATTKEDVRKAVVIDPPVPFDVATVDDGFRVIPRSELEPGTVYRISLATAIQGESGQTSDRDFSWAVQTKDTFRVLSSVPADTGAGVPVNTGIEVTMSQTGWEDPTPFFSIEPKVDGRFETHGRALTFVPARPLQPGQIYTVRYRPGWKVAGSNLALAQEHVIRFETEAVHQPDPGPRIQLSGTFFEARVDQEAMVQVYDYGYEQLQEAKVTGYALTSDQVKELMRQEGAVPAWAWETRQRRDVFAPFATTQVFTATSTIERATMSNVPSLRIPAQRPGFYLVRLLPANATSTSVPGWFVLQVTDVATHLIADDKQTIMWVVDAATGKPLSRARVTGDGIQTSTDDSGIARFTTPATVKATSTRELLFLSVEDSDSRTALASIEGGTSPWQYAYVPWLPTRDQSIGYVYADRPLYHPNDRAELSGLIQDRDTHAAPQDRISLVLRRSGFLDYSSFTSKVYSEQTIQPDAEGFFRASIEWKTLAPGYYDVALMQNSEEIVSRSIEIRDFVKPAYVLEVIPEKTAIFAGESLEGRIKATLFDGTPLARQTLSVELRDSLTYNATSTLVTTDEFGTASYRFATRPSSCDIFGTNYYCATTWTHTITAHPTGGEEARIFGSASVNTWSGRSSLDLELRRDGTDASATFTVRTVDLSKINGRSETSVLTDPIAGARIIGRVIERRWKRIEDGVMYDPIEKRTVPRYRYETEEKDVRRIDLTSSADGRATLRFPMEEGVWYLVTAVVEDGRGGRGWTQASVSRDWFDQGAFFGSQPQLQSTDGEEHVNYRLGERVSVSFFQDGKIMSEQSTPTFLFLEAQRGIRNVNVSRTPTYAFPYREELIPNMMMYGVVFLPKYGFVQSTYSATFDAGHERKLNVRVTTDRDSYAPGAQVNATIEARLPDGRPAIGARVTLAAVDEALFAAAGGSYTENPLDWLYRWVSDGILLTQSSHDRISAMAGPGGAEMGGGGGAPDALRRQFKDTAHFEMVQTDAEGRATVQFTVPDNLTSWRLTAIALTDDLFAGAAQGKAPVTKPVFVDAVIPESLLTADEAKLKFRMFGVGIPAGQPVSFTINAPTLGISNKTVTGTADLPVFVDLVRPAAGKHRVVILLNSAKGTDALERWVTVVSSRFTKNELLSTELGPGVSLPDIGGLPEVTVSFVTRGQGAYLWRLRNLVSSNSSRVESKIAARLAGRLLRDVYQDASSTHAEASLLAYQKDTGGIAILPFSGEDLELSAKIAATDASAFDRARLARYFWEITDRREVAQEDAIRALAGLAALGEPVLPRLQTWASQQGLGWREQLALARGLEAAGDREAARGLLDALLRRAEERDGLMSLPVDSDPHFVMQATAEVAALAASLGHASAERFDAYLEKNWETDVLNDLDRAFYLERIIPTLPRASGTLKYTTGGEEKTLSFKHQPIHTAVLTSDEAKAFRATSVDDRIDAVFTRRIAARPAVSPDLSLTREYQIEGKSIDQLVEGDTVTVRLVPTWKPLAQDGCYVVRDHLPSGIAPLQSLSFEPYLWSGGWYPIDVGNGSISFVVCKGDPRPEISYQARVIGRGTYRAEPAVLQSLEAPSVAALSQEAQITIK